MTADFEVILRVSVVYEVAQPRLALFVRILCVQPFPVRRLRDMTARQTTPRLWSLPEQHIMTWIKSERRRRKLVED